MLVLSMIALVIGVAGPSPVSAAYPGANGKIVFTRANQVYSINAGGGGLVQLTTGNKNYWPRWSPNGKRIAYIRETNGRRDIWVMNANGSSKQQVTNLGNVTPPTWSPDGTKLAFGGGAIGDFAYLLTIKSTAPFGAPTTLQGYTDGVPANAEPMVIEGGAAWAPNGQNIFFYSSHYPSSPDHYILQFNVPSGALTAWVASGGSCCGPGSVTQPAVSANGSRVAYTYTDGAPKILVSSFPTFGSVAFTTQAQDEQLAFSPNDQRVALMNDANGTARIFTARANGTGRTFLTNGYQPDWQPLP